MKMIIYKTRWVCVFLILLMVLQSCSVYRSKSGTFDEAAAAKTKVKATTIHGDKLIIKKIEKIDGVYYGKVNTDENGYKRIILNEKDYEKIRVKNKPVSTLLTVGLVFTPIVVGAAVAAAAVIAAPLQLLQ